MTGINLVEHFVETQPDFKKEIKDDFKRKFITHIELSSVDAEYSMDQQFVTLLFNPAPITIFTNDAENHVKLDYSQNGKYISEIKFTTIDKDYSDFKTLCELQTDNKEPKNKSRIIYKQKNLSEITKPTFLAISNIKILKTNDESVGEKMFNNYKESYPSLLSDYILIEEGLYLEKSHKKQYIVYELTEFHISTLEPTVISYTFTAELKNIFPTAEINNKLNRSVKSINHLITTFIAPYGFTFEKDVILKDYFILQNFLTDQSGQESYVTTLVFYETFFWEEKNIHGVVQKAHSIISKVPAFKFFSEVLYFIFNNQQQRDDILYPLYFTRLYTKNNIKLKFPGIHKPAIDEESIEDIPELVFESELSLPFINHNDFSLIFSFITLGNICKLLTILLLEKSVIITSYNENLLTPIIESLRTLMYPFEWQFSVIPMLEHTMQVLLDAPIPLLIGVKGAVDHIHDRVVFNVEAGRFINLDNDSKSDTNINLFEPYMVELAEDLRLGGLYYNIETLKLSEVQNFSEVGSRTAFLRVFINMLDKLFLENLLFPSLDEKENSKSGYFELYQLIDVRKYKKERQKKIKKLKPPANWIFIFNDFVKTDCFYRFVYNCSFPNNEPLYFFTSDNYTNLFKVCSVKEKIAKRSYFHDVMTNEYGFTTFDISSLEEEALLLRVPFNKELSSEKNILSLNPITLKRLQEYFEIRSNRKTKYLMFSKTSRNLISDIIENKPNRLYRISNKDGVNRNSLSSSIYYGTSYRPTKDKGTDSTIINILDYFKTEYNTVFNILSNPKKVDDFLKFRRDTANIVVIIWLVIANTTRNIRVFKKAIANKTEEFDKFFEEFTNIFNRLKIAPSKVILELCLSVVNALNDPMYIVKTCGIMKKYNISISKVFYKKNLAITRLSLTRTTIEMPENKSDNEATDAVGMENKNENNKVVFKVGRLCKCGYYMDWLSLISNFVTEYYALVRCPNCQEEFIPYIDVLIGRKQMNVLLFTPLLVLQTMLEDVEIKEDILQLKKSIYTNNEENIFKRNKDKITNSKTLMDHNTQLYYNVAIYLLTFNMPINLLSSMKFEMVEYRNIQETDEDKDFMAKVEKALNLDNLEGAILLFLSMRRINIGNNSIFHRNMFKIFVEIKNKSENVDGIENFKVEYYKKIKELPNELQKYLFFYEEQEHSDYSFINEYFRKL